LTNTFGSPHQKLRLRKDGVWAMDARKKKKKKKTKKRKRGFL
jgi:prophage tail gpP-like protein